MADVWIDDPALTAMLHDPAGPTGRAIEIGAFAVENKAKLNLLEPGSGRTYTRLFYYAHFDSMGERISIAEARQLRAMHGGTYSDLSSNPEADYGGMQLHTYGHRPAHTASAPGQSAASDTGMLVASTGHRILVGDDGPYALVGSPLAHALYTELGTREVPAGPGEHRGMVERPWLRPALDVIPEVLPL
jgi:hypothetical protein